MKTKIGMVTLTLCLLSVAWAQEPEFPETDPVRHAIQSYELHQWDRALAEFLALAESHRGTPEGSNCLFWASDVALLAGDEAQSLAILNRIAQEYASTNMGLLARLRLIERTSPNSREERVAAYDQLAQAKGAPSLAILIDPARKVENMMKIRSLPRESRNGLRMLYARVVDELGFHPPQEAAVLGQVLRGALDRDGGAEFYVSLYDAARNSHELRGLWSPTQEDFQNPVVAPLNPSDGSTVAPGGMLEAQLYMEDFYAMGLDLATLRVSLDGQDVTNSSTFECSAGPEFVDGQPWEVVTVRSPMANLSNGTHTATVTCQVYLYPGQGPGITTKTWSFTIANQASEAALYPSKDSTLRLRDPHLNEGANPRLILEKIQGKTTRALVGFDMSQQNLTGLTSASLVLTVDPSDSPTGWGNGRNVLAAPISTGWLEGNGVDFGVPSSQKTSGSGAGVTWFSPVDEDISNNYANSAVNWNGAGAASGPPTALAVQIHNHQTGEVSFDVTQDVLNGSSSWLVRREDENVGSQVHFYSREGGGASAGPRLVLHYGASANKPAKDALLARAWDTPAAVLRNLAGLGGLVAR